MASYLQRTPLHRFVNPHIWYFNVIGEAWQDLQSALEGFHVLRISYWLQGGLEEVRHQMELMGSLQQAPESQLTFDQGLRSSSRAMAALTHLPQENTRSAVNPSPSPGKSIKQTYPLYPSVAQLLHQKGLPASESEKIPATGPKGRLLKGDVLAYLGEISASYSSEQSARIAKLGRLDLSKIQIAPPKNAEAPIPAKPTAEALRLNQILVDDLFNQILGIQSKKPKPVQHESTSQANPSPSPPLVPQTTVRSVKSHDIIDILTARHPLAGSI